MSRRLDSSLLADLRSCWTAPVCGCLLLVISVLVGSGCGPRLAVEELDATRSWELIELPPPEFPLGRTLNLLVWKNYLPLPVVARFEKAYGVTVHVVYFSENEELHARLLDLGQRFDLVMPGTYMVQQLIRERRLKPLDRTHIPNIRFVDQQFFHLKHDPALKYSVPIYQETAGIVFNSKYASGLPLTWPELANDTGKPLVRGRLAVIDEMRSTLGTALLMQNLSPNTRDPAEIARARDLLILVKSETGLQFQLDDEPRLLIDDKLILGTAWTGDAAKALAFNGDVRFIVPRGASITELDSFCIPVNAEHADTAEFFINYLLTPEITAAMTNFSYYANTSSASRAFISPIILNGPAYMQPLPNSGVFLEDVDSAAEYYRAAWQAVKAAPEPEVIPVPLPFPRSAPNRSP